MSTYTWKTQLSKNYSDQFQPKGSIDKEKAIEEFQLFPWDKELDDFKRSIDNPTIPKIIFDSNDQRQLIIEAIDIEGYRVEYSNFSTGKFSEIYISNDFEKNNLSTEEIIDLFFDNTIEPHLKLKDIAIPGTEETEEKIKESPECLEFNFKSNNLSFISPRAFLWLGIALIYLRLSYVGESNLPMLGNIFLISICLTPILIHLTYFLKNYSAKAKIDTRNHEITYMKGSKEIKFNRDDIYRCQVTTGKRSLYSTVHNYSYVWFILNNGKHITLTCFMADPYEIIAALNCKCEEKQSILPFLPI